MRRILLAGLLASPMFLTAAAYAGTPAENASVSAPVRPVSTGLIDPKLIRSATVEVSPEIASSIPIQTTVVLQLKLDENGTAQQIQVVKSVRPDLDARVVEAVKQFRWTPAMLDNKAIALPLTLNVQIQH